jgi:cobalt-zinc-cadmium efflux system protein
MHQHTHVKGNESSARIGWAFFLNVGFTFIEFIGGWLTNSTAIMADAVHDLGDSLSIGLAWLLNKVSDKHANDTYSYGYQRFSLLGALINGVVLVSGSIWILNEALPRLSNPEMPDAQGMILLSIFGVAVNGFAAYKLSRGKSLNERVLNWHLLEDVLGWIAVLIVAIVLLFAEIPILDPILSIGFTLFILFNVTKNLTETIKIFLQATPDDATRTKVIEDLGSLKYVSDVHHVHLWTLDGNNHVLTAHLALDKLVDQSTQTSIKKEVAALLIPYKLSHTTIELEFPDENCRDNKE